MKLQDNKYITEQVARRLEKDDWTIETLATARPSTLEKYKGVGKVTAKEITREAERLVNEEKLHEAASFAAPAEAQPTEEDLPASARVRRIREINQQ